MTSHLLMVGGDTVTARGEQGPFYNTLSEFVRYWDSIDVLTRRVPGVSHRELFGNVMFHPSPWPTAAYPFFVASRGRKLIAQKRHQLIVSHDYGLFLNGIGAAWLSRATGVPYVSEIHHVEGYPRAASWHERMQPTLARWYVRWTMRRAKGFRVVNETELKPLLMRWGIPEAQLLVLPSLYLDFDVFRPLAAALEYDAMFCGRLAANKAPLLFLDALAVARERLGELHALMVGRGPLSARVKARARQLKLDVEFVDWVETPAELAELYRRSKCLVCASYSEGGPRVVAEALACGVPAITTRVGIARELVRDGENGFQADWSARELGERLSQIAADDSLRSRLSASAPQAVRRFERSQIIRDYALAYRQLI
ncbi:MAG: glycosyltransferase family 4 protein [Chloroflexi bacterium]|nr:glycosyltransferase family 4 protein [Chloroflexota bacterium]